MDHRKLYPVTRKCWVISRTKTIQKNIWVIVMGPEISQALATDKEHEEKCYKLFARE